MLLIRYTLLLQFSWLFPTGFHRPEDASSKREVRHDFLLLLTPTSTILRLSLSTTVSIRTGSMPDASTGRSKPTKANSEAKREAQARYRARHKEELRRKARESMARLRANLSPHQLAQYQKTAREDGARYRAENRAMLAQKEVVRRARKSIPRIGYDEWCAKYEKRHKRPVPVVLQMEYGPQMTTEADSRAVSPGPTTTSFQSRSTTDPTTTSVQSCSTADPPTVPTPPRLAPSWRLGYAGCPGLFDVGPPPPGWAIGRPLQPTKVRASSLPPSSAPSSSSGWSENGLDPGLEVRNAPLVEVEDARRRADARRKVNAWLPRTK
ncbi:hypothetical protein DFH06DRAFT_1327904 [Mycena polygramma]|nr:hypothetical protein DFH06DRAFT_1327904 [Mycena polygramma]